MADAATHAANADSMAALLERIRTDAVNKGRDEAQAIVEHAQAEAQAIRAQAQQEADALRTQAREDADRWQAQAEQTLRQAARDLLLTLRASIQNVFGETVQEEVEQAITQDVLVTMLEQVASGCAANPRDATLEIILSPKDKEALASFFLKQFQEGLMQGFEIRADSDILKGFRLSSRDGHMYIDFTSQAIAKSLAALVRPALAEHLEAAATTIQHHDSTADSGGN